MRIYIAGPMSNLPEWNYPAFHHAAERLTARGFTPINPARAEGRDGCTAWVDYMRASIRDLADCDGVCTLTGWGESRGAALEVHVARSLDFPVRSLSSWLALGPGHFTEFNFTAEPVHRVRPGDEVVVHLSDGTRTRFKAGTPQSPARLYPLHVVPKEDTDD